MTTDDAGTNQKDLNDGRDFRPPIYPPVPLSSSSSSSTTTTTTTTTTLSSIAPVCHWSSVLARRLPSTSVTFRRPTNSTSQKSSITNSTGTNAHRLIEKTVLFYLCSSTFPSIILTQRIIIC
jgi:hypothetical protein